MKKVKGRNLDLKLAEPSTPAAFALFYGIYKFIDLGVSFDHYLYTYVPVFGSILSIVGIFMFAYAGSKHSKNELSPKYFFMTMVGFIPWAFSIYLIGFLGVYSLWQLIDNFSFWSLVFGISWILIGYRMLSTFSQFSELVKNKQIEM